MTLPWKSKVWEQKVWDNRARAKGCMIQYNDTHIAAIGGTPKECSDKIDTYNFVTEEFQENVATLLFNRTHHLCALIPEGKDGNPTVVICKYFLSLFCFRLSLSYGNDSLGLGRLSA